LTAVLWVAAGVPLVWAVARLVGFKSGLLTVQLLAFTPYVAVASLVPLVAAIATRRILPALAAALAVVALAVCVVPRWVQDGDTGAAKAGGPALRVLSVNMLFGGADPATVVKLVRTHQVDLVAFQEFTGEGQAALESAGLRDVLPHRIAYPASGVTGSALYSRFPLTDGGVRVHKSGFQQAMATLAVPGAAALQVESVHPCAPTGDGAPWDEDVVDQPPATASGPIRLLIGDFNATLDHPQLRALIDTGYRDAGDVVGAGYDTTWPYDERWYIPGVTIDHVLADRRVGVERVKSYHMPNSDHRALFAALRLPPR
jgi:endonuclease/exonuclease/phosphatase (EEP) superfamily protein YafD